MPNQLQGFAALPHNSQERSEESCACSQTETAILHEMLDFMLKWFLESSAEDVARERLAALSHHPNSHRNASCASVIDIDRSLHLNPSNTANSRQGKDDLFSTLTFITPH